MLGPAVCGALYLFIGVWLTGNVCGESREQVCHQSISRIVQIMRICNIQLYIWVGNKYFFQRSNLAGSVSWHGTDPAPDDVIWKRKWLPYTIWDIYLPKIFNSFFHNASDNVWKVAGTNAPEPLNPKPHCSLRMGNICNTTIIYKEGRLLLHSYYELWIKSLSMDFFTFSPASVASNWV